MKTMKRRFKKSFFDLEKDEMDEIEITPFTEHSDPIPLELYKELSEYIVALEVDFRSKGLREISLIFD